MEIATTHTIGGKELTLAELQKGWNIPVEHVDVVGKNLVSTNADEFIRRENFKQIWRCFPLDGHSTATYNKIYDHCFADNDEPALRLFDDRFITKALLRDAGLGPRQSENFINKLNEHKFQDITYDVLLSMLNIVGCGRSIRKQYGHKLSGNPYNFSGLTKDIIEQLDNSTEQLTELTESLHVYAGIGISKMEVEKVIEITEDTVTYVMTGRPQACGFDGTKKDFQAQLPENWIEAKKLTESTTYLVAGDSNSNSSKAKTARKNGTKVITYIDVINLTK